MLPVILGSLTFCFAIWALVWCLINGGAGVGFVYFLVAELFILLSGILFSYVFSHTMIMKITAWCLFGVYLLFLIMLLFFDGGFGRIGMSGSVGWSFDKLLSYIPGHANLIPFKTVLEYIKIAFSGGLFAFAVNIFGNIFAFFPMGVFLPLLCPKMRSFPRFLIFMLLILLLVETLQLLLLTGAFDVDDIILNAAGACIAFVIEAKLLTQLNLPLRERIG